VTDPTAFEIGLFLVLSAISLYTFWLPLAPILRAILRSKREGCS
jgi:hypothetical protein